MDAQEPPGGPRAAAEPGAGPGSGVAFAGQVSPQHFRQAMRLYSRARRLIWVPGFILALSLVAGLVTVGGWHSWWPVALVSAAWLAMLVAMPFIAARRFRSSYPQDEFRLSGEVRPDGIRVESPYGLADRPWISLYRYRADDRLLLLYIGAEQFYVLAREFFASEEDWRRARRWAMAGVPAKPRDPSRWLVFLLWMVVGAVAVLVLWVLRS